MKLTYLIMYVIFVSVLLVGVVSASVTDSDRGLYYNFSEGSGTSVADNWNSYTGTATSSSLWISSYPSFHVNGSGSPSAINGSDLYAVNTSYNLNLSDYSVSMWIKMESDASACSLYGDENFDSNNYFQLKYVTVGKLKVADRRDGTITLFQTNDLGINNNTWVHVVVTAQAGKHMELWINNVNITSFASGSNAVSSNDLNLTSQGFAIGGRNTKEVYTNDFFDGAIDEFKFWTAPLDETQIGNLYDCGSINCSVASAPADTNSTPTPSLSSPVDEANFINQTWMEFSCSYTGDDASADLNLYLDGVLNQTNADTLNNTAWTVNVTLPYANYSVICEADDGNSKANTTAITFALVEDTTPAPASNTSL